MARGGGVRGLRRPPEPAGRRTGPRPPRHPAGRRWLDVGCGTGTLTEEVLRVCSPALVLGLDPSASFVGRRRPRRRRRT
ncbi:methyltransferase domain-containing protein [Geodermatophilus sp. URMC 61]|uniref:methyltransferase domain-containing protein n=1 Tax=Geodermatophilus sp. URMC 61 TaxID=3423411 RepID=UPI00406CC72D